MSLQFTRVGSQVGNLAFPPGRLDNVGFTLTGIPPFTTAYFQVRLFETSAGSYGDAENNHQMHGASPVFSVSIASSIAFHSLVSHFSPGYSTWPDAPIVLSTIPEPSVMSMAGLGLVALLVRRRK